ncbi:MAG: acyl-CoA thioesterase II [bacterium]|nr:acyl-CoA thioesterase II [bacterium]
MKCIIHAAIWRRSCYPIRVSQTLSDLIGLLELEKIDQNIFRGENETASRTRLFGGQVAAQSLAAAGRTIEDLYAHSLHAYFLRPGDTEVPVLYTVDRIRDGRSFATRRVVAIQNGKAIFNMAVSFHKEETGYEHQQIEMPDVPDPESLPTWAERVEVALKGADPPVWLRSGRPVDVRHVNLPSYMGSEPRTGPSSMWFRADGDLGDDLLLHQCVLTYASDISLVDNTVLPHGRNGALGPVMIASLDHAIWFHQPFRADEWLLYAQESPRATGARGFARGTIFSRDGTLIASVAQEGLLRPTGKPEDRSL